MHDAAPDATAPSIRKRDRRRLRDLERRLAEARAQESRRSSRLEQAQAAGAPRKIERRARKLARARARGERLAAQIAELRGPAAQAVMGYCLRDRERVEIRDPQPVTL